MSSKKDWWPGSREAQLAMIGNWLEHCLANSTRWKIEIEVIQELGELSDKAHFALKAVQNKSTNSSMAREDCREAFRLLKIAARDMKKRYFIVPPLTRTDLISLWLKVPDTHPTPSGNPTAKARVDTFLKGRYELGWKITYCDGEADDPANKNFRLYYLVADKSDSAPVQHDDLHKSFSTRKKKGVLRFEPKDSRKVCYMTVQVENGEMKGPWGPITEAVIP